MKGKGRMGQKYKIYAVKASQPEKNNIEKKENQEDISIIEEWESSVWLELL